MSMELELKKTYLLDYVRRLAEDIDEVCELDIDQRSLREIAARFDDVIAYNLGHTEEVGHLLSLLEEETNGEITLLNLRPFKQFNKPSFNFKTNEDYNNFFKGILENIEKDSKIKPFLRKDFKTYKANIQVNWKFQIPQHYSPSGSEYEYSSWTVRYDPNKKGQRTIIEHDPSILSKFYLSSKKFLYKQLPNNKEIAIPLAPKQYLVMRSLYYAGGSVMAAKKIAEEIGSSEDYVQKIIGTLRNKIKDSFEIQGDLFIESPKPNLGYRIAKKIKLKLNDE